MQVGDNSNYFCHNNINYKSNMVQEILKESVEQEDVQVSCSGTPSLTWQASQITDTLFLCSASMVNEKLLNALNIGCVISAAPELPSLPLEDPSVIFHSVSVMDSCSADIIQFFDEVSGIIHAASERRCKTLVYCVAGVSRSASLCIAYLMKYHNLSLLDAYNHVKSRRPRIKPNCNFFKQLIQYEKQLKLSTSVSMVYSDVIQMEIPSVYECDYKQCVNAFRKRPNMRHVRY